jgi:hypothetical protein
MTRQPILNLVALAAVATVAKPDRRVEIRVSGTR